MSQPTTEEMSATVAQPTTAPPTLAEVAENIRMLAAQAHEYLIESVVPFGGE